MIKDKLVQFELRQILKELFEDIQIEDANRVQLITACFQ